MTIKIQTALDLQGVLSILSNEKMPVKMAYQMYKILSSLEESATFYREKLSQIIDTYAEKDENNNYVTVDESKNIKVKEDKIKECQEKMTELNCLEVEIPDCKFKIEDFEGFELTFLEMKYLTLLLED